MSKTKEAPKLLALSPDDVSERTGFNTRYDMGDLRPIESGMAERGYDPSEPLIVSKDLATEDKYLLGAQGHRRLTVAKKLHSEGKLPNGIVYAIEEDSELTDADRNLDIIRLNTGAPLAMLEQARVIKRAFYDAEGNETMTKRDLARALGLSDTFVGNCLKLLKTTERTQKMIEKDKVSSFIVVELFNEHKGDVEKVEAAVDTLIEDAEKSGKTKAKKPKKADKEDSEEDEEAKEEEKAAKAAVKARLKELTAFETRAVKFMESTQENVASISKDTPEFDASLHQLLATVAAFLAGKSMDSAFKIADKGEITKASDVTQAYRVVLKNHKETVKDIEKDAKETVKDAEAQAKAEIKAKEEAIKKALKK